MNFLNKLERKFGRYAISNISLYLILCYGCGYLINLINPVFLNYLTLNPYMILHGQVWRLVTWIIVPPSSLNFWTIIMLYFYYSIGTSLERTWGAFYYNVYLFMGMIFTVLGSFLIMVLSYVPNTSLNMTMLINGQQVYFSYIALFFSTYYINMSIFLGFAATFPNVQVLLMFIIPIKVKWMGIAYAVMLAFEMIQGDIIVRIAIGASLLNFVVFFLMTRRGLGMRISPKQVKRRHDYRQEIRKARPMSVSKHKCAICGKNSEGNPDAEFRFCSKCNGNYEYCQDHLFTHTHVK
ncbi:MAG: rhomboid family intramembrane serine protease [Roseburia sp.]|nr:rhomboid family intramembrane serine protease [Roseburia sp.]